MPSKQQHYNRQKRKKKRLYLDLASQQLHKSMNLKIKKSLEQTFRGRGGEKAADSPEKRRKPQPPHSTGGGGGRHLQERMAPKFPLRAYVLPTASAKEEEKKMPT